jgi:putative transposase
MIRDYQASTRIGWSEDEQKIIPTYGKHSIAKLFSLLDYESGEIFCRQGDHNYAKLFLNFRKYIISRYSSGRMIMTLEYARNHHAKLIQPFLLAHRDG